MKKLILITCLITLSIFSYASFALPSHDHFSTQPYTNKGKKWRLGYLEGGPYLHYQTNLVGFIQGLVELNWIAPLTIPALPNEHDTRYLWTWLSQNVQSDYLEFVADSYWSAEWDSEKRPVVRQQVLTQLQQHQLNLILALGTWAGQDLANDLHNVPTMVMSISDAVAAGVVDSATDSGLAHVHARLDSTRYEKQLQLFHHIAKFNTLGVVYEDSLTGRSYAGITRIQKMADRLGFTIKTCHENFHTENAEQATIACYQKLAPEVDAFYITYNVGVKVHTLPALLKPILEYQRPSFSQAGQKEVAYGVLMSMSDANYAEVGLFHASTMAKIFNGAVPRYLSQEFSNPYRLAINLETERRINFTFPPFILTLVDEIYETIAIPPPLKE